MKMPEIEITKLYRKAFKFGENLMPCDCAEIIGKTRIKKYGKQECASVIVELMERCNFYCDMHEALQALE